VLLLPGSATLLASQERPAKRLADIVSVAFEEYASGIDAAGRLISSVEYQEAVEFLGNAREVAARLSGERGDSARVLLDSIRTRVASRVPPSEVSPWVDRLMASLGADAALDLPTTPVDLTAGQRLYEAHCSTCHGLRGLGDGPSARGMDPPPPALGSADAVADVSPALMYRILSVGIAGTPMVAFSGTLSVDERWSVIAYVNSLRAPSVLAEGQGLYVQRCAACHGPAGASNGTLSAALSRVPVELSSFAWQAARSDREIATMIRDGLTGTAMPPSRDLRAEEVATLVAYVRTLSLTDAPGAPVIAGDSAGDPGAVLRAVKAQLDAALLAARAGRSSDAADRAFDAYIAFEPLETRARARDPGLVASLERHFADFRGAVRASDVREAERAYEAIEQGMPGIVDLTRPSGGRWGAFLQSLLIILREGLEAILVIGAIVAFLIKTGHRERLRSIWWGVGTALGASAVTAVVLATVLRALPATREVIEGITMLVAVAVLFSVSYWLISKVEAARWQQFIREKVDAALAGGGGRALTLVAFLAVYREGAETALFYQALLHDAGATLPIVAGIVVGGAVLAVIFTLFHRYGVRIPLRPFFGVTSVLLYYMAFVFMGKGIRELQEGNVMPITVLPGWPHIDAMGIFPSVETLLGQGVLLTLFVFALVKTFWPQRAVVLPTMPASATGTVQDELGRVAQRLAQLERRLESLEESAGTSPEADDSRDASLLR
jgi:high-affinity iron transporter